MSFNLTEDFRLGAAIVRPALSELEMDGECVRLEPKVMALLIHLIEHAESVVTRQFLMDEVWPDVVVTDESLTRGISEIRSALGDDPKSPAYVQTVPKKGYRLLQKPQPLNLQNAQPPEVAAQSPQKTKRQGLMVALVFLSILVAGGIWFGQRAAESESSPKEPRQVATSDTVKIGVLPIESLSDNSEDGYLATGMTRDVIQQLSMIPGLGVVPLSSMMEFAGAQQSPRAIAAAVDARFLVTGQIEPRGDGFRLRLSLLDTQQNIQLWSQNYDRSLNLFFTVQDTLVREIATALSSEIQLGAVLALERGQFNATAYQLIEGAEQLRRNYNQQAAQQIEAQLRQALAMQADNPVAHALLGMQLAQNLVSGWSQDTQAARERIREHMDLATKGAPRNARVLMAAGIGATMMGDHDSALRYLSDSFALNPNEAHTLAELGYAEFRVDDNLDACRDKTLQAEQLAPNHPRLAFWSYRRGTCLFLAGLYAEASETLEYAIQRNPGYYHTYFFRSLALFAEGNDDLAVESMRKGMRLAPELQKDDFLNGVLRFGVPLGPGLAQFEKAWSVLVSQG
ncbi:MAG: winged helix-turn-helix domain-containing protein [Pseudomonadota bacterium]